MNSPVLLTIIASLFLTSAKAAKTEFRVDPIVVKAKSSFDSLNDEAFIPQKKVSFDANRNGTQDVLDKTLAFPSTNYGYPSGAMGTRLGGLSIEDTQVSTLGVPLNLPQGGGPDLSLFPAFLWSGASISSVPQLGGYSPQGVSGSIQFDLWTRTAIRDYKPSTDLNRITGSYDRNLQNFSVATKKQTSAILVGMNFGRMKGPAASISLYAIRNPRNHLLFHMLGSDQDGDDPGSKNYPTPNARKKFWRVIPVLESHQEFGDTEKPLIWKSTISADFQQLATNNPDDPIYDASAKTQQYGIENALHYENSTLALTVRQLNFQKSAVTVHDLPVMAQYSYDFQLTSNLKMKLAGGGNYMNDTGFAPSGRALLKQSITDEDSLFFELNSLNRMPTMVDRYYVDSSYRGNPNLKPARINTLIAGMENKKDDFENTTTIKLEQRNQIIVYASGTPLSTMINQGNAWLVSANEDFTFKPFKPITQRIGTVLSFSQLTDSGRSYPDLPTISVVHNGKYELNDSLALRNNLRYMGVSKNYLGLDHSDYFLADLSFDWSIKKEITATLGCDNLFDKRAEIVEGYPLPGRIAYLNLQMNL